MVALLLLALLLVGVGIDGGVGGGVGSGVGRVWLHSLPVELPVTREGAVKMRVRQRRLGQVGVGWGGNNACVR